MPIPTYTLGYPPDGSSLGQTKATIRNNLDGTFETLGVDHVNNNGVPGSNPAGYHTIIHQVTQAGPPAAISGVNQVFSMIPPSGIPSNTDTQLFTVTANQTPGHYSQLTGNNGATNGNVWCAGILIQWGTVTNAVKNGSGTTSVNLPNAYPNNFFGVIGSLSAGTTSSTLTVSQNGLDKLQYYLNSNSGQTINFTWVAFGN